MEAPAKKRPKKKGRGSGTVLTAPQAKAIALFKENIETNGGKSVQDILLEAGYSPETARQQANIMTGIRGHLDPFVQEMEEHRANVMAMMKSKLPRATYGELTRSLDTLTHNIRLLSGKSTANIGVVVSERRAAIERLIDE